MCIRTTSHYHPTKKRLGKKNNGWQDGKGTYYVATRVLSDIEGTM